MCPRDEKHIFNKEKSLGGGSHREALDGNWNNLKKNSLSNIQAGGCAEAQRESVAARLWRPQRLLDEWRLTYGHQLDALLVQELQRHGHVLQLHLPEVGPGVVLSVHFLVAEDLQQGYEPQAVAQVQLQVPDPLVDALEVLIDPAGEGVLLDLLPRGVLSQILLGGRHRRRFLLLAFWSVCGLWLLGEKEHGCLFPVLPRRV